MTMSDPIDREALIGAYNFAFVQSARHLQKAVEAFPRQAFLEDVQRVTLLGVNAAGEQDGARGNVGRPHGAVYTRKHALAFWETQSSNLGFSENLWRAMRIILGEYGYQDTHNNGVYWPLAPHDNGVGDE